MSAFRNIRIFPQHGSRTAKVTWTLAEGYAPGSVYVAFSETGLPESWRQLNDGAPIASSIGQIDDAALEVTGGQHAGFYRLMLRNVDNDFLSEPVEVCGDVSRKEYGIARYIINQEFQEMRATNGYPVWLCVPRDFGELSNNIDPFTQAPVGIECADTPPEEASYGMRFKGGFFAPTLTWIRPLAVKRGTITDAADDTAPHHEDVTSIRMLPFPRPSRGYMIVDPATDRRYLINDEINPFFLRGVLPVVYETSMTFMQQSDPRYRFPVPEMDTKAYRKMKYWW